MKYLILSFTFVLSVNFLGINAYAEEKKGLMVRFWERVSSRWEKKEPAAEPGEINIQVPDEKAAEQNKLLLSREALLKEIDDQIEKYPALIDSIPELSMRKSMDGNVDYYYKLTSDIPVKLDKYNRAELAVILDRIVKEVPLLKTQAPKVPETVGVPSEKAESLAVETEEVAKDFDALDLDAEESPEEAVVEEEPELEIPFTKEEMLEVIYKRLNTFSQIAYMIPNFTLVQQEDGTRKYYFDTDEGTVPIEDLDKKTLHRLFVRINNEATVLNTQRIMRQIQQQEQLTRAMQQQQQQIQRNIQNQAPPVIHTPPVVHTPPPQPPQLPQPPQTPPQPPRK